MFRALILIVCLLFASTVSVYGEPLTVLFTDATSTGAGDLQRSEAVDHTVFCNFSTSGGVTAVTVDLEGSLDNTNVETLASHTFSADELSAESAMFHVVNKTVSTVQGNISALTAVDISMSCYYKALRYTN